MLVYFNVTSEVDRVPCDLNCDLHCDFTVHHQPLQPPSSDNRPCFAVVQSSQSLTQELVSANHQAANAERSAEAALAARQAAEQTLASMRLELSGLKADAGKQRSELHRLQEVARSEAEGMQARLAAKDR